MTNEVLVRGYMAQDYEAVINFMNRVTTLEAINQDLILNSVLIRKGNEIIGMVSFEQFNEIGIIRYFIYDHQVSPDLIVNMFFELYSKSKNCGVNQLISIVTHQYAIQLFELLGFIEIKKPSDLAVTEFLQADNVRVMSIKF